MAEGLLGGMADEDKYLGLLGIGLGMLAGNKGRSRGEAFSNAIAGGAHGGLGLLGPIMQNKQAQAQAAQQARQFGLEERKVGAQEALNLSHGKLYQAQVDEMERTRKLLEPLLAQYAGTQNAALTPGPDGTQIGTPASAPQITQRDVNAPANAPGTFNIPTDLLKGVALAKPQLAGPLLEMYKLDQPNIEFVSGIPVDKKTGRPTGAPTLPQTAQTGAGFQHMPDPSTPGGFRTTIPPGSLDVLAAQRGVQERAAAQYGPPREIPQTSGQTQLLTPAQFADRATQTGGITAGKPTQQVISEKASEAQQVKAGQERATRQDTVFSTAYQAPQHIQRMQLIDSLLGDFEGGKFTATGYELARAFNSAGVKIDSKLSNKEAAQALGKELTLELRTAGGSNQLPGPMSDADRRFLEQMTPSMSQSAEGRKTLIGARTAISQRQLEIGQMAQKYVQKYGALDEEFFSQAARYNTTNPIFKSVRIPGAK